MVREREGDIKDSGAMTQALLLGQLTRKGKEKGIGRKAGDLEK